MFNWGDLIGMCAIAAAIAYFIGWMNGCDNGRKEEAALWGAILQSIREDELT